MSQALVRHRPDWHHDCALIVPDAAQRRALLVPGPAGWGLPRFAPREHHAGTTPHIVAAARALLGADVSVLRCVHNAVDEARRRVQRIYLVEHRDPRWSAPPGTRWVGWAELDTTGPASAVERAALRAWFAEGRGGAVPPQRVPWARPGWWAEATAWLDRQLAALGRERCGPIEQLRTWSISCLLRAPTAEGTVYFKASPATFPREAALTAALAAWQPAHLPQVLAADAARNWLLLADVGGQALAGLPALAVWESALAQFARLQMAAIPRRAALLAAGAFDRRTPWLVRGLHALVADPAALRVDRPAGLSRAAIAALRDRVPAIAADCARLPTLGIPDTLEHGDLYADNVVLVGGRAVFIDWSDGAIAPPFLALYCLLEESPGLPTDPALAARLRNAYLAPWEALAPRRRLAVAFALAQRMAPLYQALIYYHIVRHLEPAARWEWENTVPHYARLLLEAYR